MRRLCVGLAVTTVAATFAGVAGAHPVLIGSTPDENARLAKGPTAVSLRFSEPVEPVGDGITVSGPDGAPTVVGTPLVRGSTLSRSIASTQTGTYVVEWIVVGDDGHPARGAFLFSVGSPSQAALPGHQSSGVVLVGLGRWLSLLGYALGFGIIFAALLSGGTTKRLWRPVSAGIVLLLVAEPVLLLGELATLAPSRVFDAGFARDVLLTRYGHLAGLRVAAAIGLWALAGAVRRSSTRTQWSIPVAGIVVAFVYAAGSHRTYTIPASLSLTLGAAHVAAFAAWFGCIVVALAESRGRRLAQPAALAALVLVSSGAGLALAHLRAISDLVETAYGATLAVKLTLVAIALALGALGRRRAELAAALAVLAVAGVLVSLAPPV